MLFNKAIIRIILYFYPIFFALSVYVQFRIFARTIIITAKQRARKR